MFLFHFTDVYSPEFQKMYHGFGCTLNGHTWTCQRDPIVKITVGTNENTFPQCVHRVHNGKLHCIELCPFADFKLKSNKTVWLTF